MNLAQLVALTLEIGKEGAKLKRSLDKRPRTPIGDHRFIHLEAYRATYDRLVSLMPQDFIDQTTDAFSGT